MTVDLSVAPADLSATCRRQIAEITGSATYTAGGETIAPEDFRMGKIFIVLGSIWNGTAQLTPQFIPATPAVIWVDPATGLDVGTVDLSGYTGRVEVIGQ